MGDIWFTGYHSAEATGGENKKFRVAKPIFHRYAIRYQLRRGIFDTAMLVM